MKKIVLFLLTGFCFANCSALSYGGCDYSDVVRMKAIVSNINISYDYKIVDDEAYFDVTINNLTNDIYFYDTANKKNYYYSDSNNGEIIIYNYSKSGGYKFYSNNNSCYGIALGNKYYNFPKYNTYYNDPLCLDIPNYSLCQKWKQVNVSRTEFEEMVNQYKNVEKEEQEITIQYQKTTVDKLIEFYINYYYYFFGGIIIILTPIIIIKNKKNRFDL